MHLYTFTRQHRPDEPHAVLSTPASSLHEATLLLPATWKIGPNAGFSVVIRPIESELDYWKARCTALELQLKSFLREPHGQ